MSPAQSSSKPVLAIDLDDTLVDNAIHVIEAYNRIEGGTISLNDVYVAQKLGDPLHGWHHNRDEARIWIRDYLVSEEGLAESRPLPETIAALKQLAEQYELWIVTGRNLTWQKGTKEWVDRYLPGLFAGIRHCGDTPKSEVCAEINAHTIIDDSPYYLSFCVKAGMQAILFGEYPWNADAPEAGITRAKDWDEVVEVLLGSQA